MKKQALNPYLPSWEYVPDGEPYVFNGRVYVYGSHDFYNGYVFCMGDYVCWSAPVDDLGNWRYEGTMISRKMNWWAGLFQNHPSRRKPKKCFLVSVISIERCRHQIFGKRHRKRGSPGELWS